MRSRSWARMVVLALCSFGMSALAEAQEMSPAEKLFREAREDMKRQDYTAACPKFEQSLQLMPMPGTLLNLSECEEKQGRLVESLRHLRDAVAKLPPNDDRVPGAKTRESDLAKRVPTVTVRLAADMAAGTRVTVDGGEVPPDRIGGPVELNPGKHTFEATAPNGTKSSKVIHLSEGDRGEVRLNAPSKATPSQTTGPEKPDAGSSISTWGYVVGGLGIVGLAVGAGFALKAKSLDDDARQAPHYYPSSGSGSFCDQTCADKNKDARSAATIAQLAIGGGAALLVGGAAMILFAPSSPQRESGRVSISPTAGPGMAGVQMGGAW